MSGRESKKTDKGVNTHLESRLESKVTSGNNCRRADA
jgi:hypothetical protein